MKSSLKVFLSSTVSDLAAEREIAFRAIETLGLQAIRMEALGSTNNTPPEICKHMVEESDVFIGIYGGRYGYVLADQSLSITEFEFNVARRTGKDIFIYVKETEAVDPEQTRFLRRVTDFEGGYLLRPKFRTLTEIEEWLREDLVALLSSRFVTTHISSETNLKDQYRAYISNFYGKVTFAGLAQTPSGLSVPLRHVYVAPNLREIDTLQKAEAGVFNIDHVLSPLTRALIVGAPGSGKTTLLKHFACDIAQRTDSIALGLLPVLVPVISLTEGDSSLTFYERLSRFVASRSDPRFEGVVHDAVVKSKAIIFLDGLDEITNSDYVDRVLSELTVFCQQFPSTRVVLTTRPSGQRQIPGFRNYEIQPFTQEQIFRFVELWSAALGEDLQVSSKSGDLFHSLVQHQAILDLAQNPMFLTLLAFLHRQGFPLLTRRVEIYEAIVKTMVESWDRARSLSHAFARQFRQPEVEYILSQLALAMTQRGQRTITTAEILSLIGDDPNGSELSGAWEMFEAVSDRTGLLFEVAEGRYSFMHAAFQEFFTAKAIASMKDNELIRFMVDHFYDSEYEEVVRLALSWMDAHGRQALVPQIAEELLNAATN